MCFRKLWFDKHTLCGHLTFTHSEDVDCGESICYNSTAHPSTCSPPTCECRRYFTQPERLVSKEYPTKCGRCASTAS